MGDALLYVSISGGLFLTLLVLTTLEEVRGRRLLLGGARAALDRLIERVYRSITEMYQFVARHIIQLSWYYSLHAFLKTTLRVIAHMYHVIESWLHHNRKKARVIRAERSKKKRTHLSAVAEHKASMQLTDEEKARIRAEHLER